MFQRFRRNFEIFKEIMGAGGQKSPKGSGRQNKVDEKLLNVLNEHFLKAVEDGKLYYVENGKFKYKYSYEFRGKYIDLNFVNFSKTKHPCVKYKAVHKCDTLRYGCEKTTDCFGRKYCTSAYLNCVEIKVTVPERYFI